MRPKRQTIPLADRMIAGTDKSGGPHRGCSEETKAPIPTGIYYLAESDNFYMASENRGMGWTFYDKWRPRKEEFPVLCEGCPPVGYPTDKTRCADCPRLAHPEGAA